tara:strand:+ start:215 stop:628 length:414 start_codon:yes stop_codon:yes gene_type:complete
MTMTITPTHRRGDILKELNPVKSSIVIVIVIHQMMVDHRILRLMTPVLIVYQVTHVTNGVLPHKERMIVATADLIKFHGEDGLRIYAVISPHHVQTVMVVMIIVVVKSVRLDTENHCVNHAETMRHVVQRKHEKVSR